MIDFLSNWAEQLVVAVIIATIIEMILPNNNNKKYIKMVIGIYILFNIISPFIKNSNFSLEDFNLENYTVQTTFDEINQETMDARLQDLYIQELEKNVQEKIKEQGYEIDKCKIDAVLKNEENAGINKIELKIHKSNIKNNNNNIEIVNKIEINIGNSYNKDEENTKITKQEIENLKNILSQYYEIDKSKINIK